MDNKIIIENINIAAFGKLCEKNIDLDPKVNLITAPNEGGKSTLAAFIRFALYGFQGRSQSISDNPKKMYTPWSGAAAKGSLTLQTDRRLRIERTVVGSKETATLTDIATGEGLFTDKPFGEEIFGIGGDIYEKTAFLSTTQPPQSKDEALADRLQNLVFSADEQISGAGAEKLLTKQKNALKGRAGNGTVYALEDKAARLEEQLRTELEAAERLEELEGAKKRLQEGLDTATERYSAAEKALENAERYQAVLLLAEREDLEKAAKEARLAAHTEVPDLEEIEALRALRDEYNAHKDRRLNAESLYADLSSKQTAADPLIKSKITKAKKALKTSKAAATALFVSGAVALIAAVAMLALDTKIYLLPGVLGLALVLGGVLAIAMGNSAIKKADFANKAQLETVEARLADEENHNRDLEFRKVDAKRRVEELAEIENRTLAALRAGLAKTATQDEDVNEAIKTLYERHSVDIILKTKASNAENALTAFDQKHPVEELDKKARGAVKPEKDRHLLELERKAEAQRMEGYRAKLYEAGEAIAAIKGRGYTPTATAEALSYTKAQLEAANDNYAALCIALEELSAAGNSMKESISPRLAGRAGELFEKMTHGRHKSLELDTKLALTVDQKSGEHLSAGARDGVYLCLRLALIELLYGGKSIPLVLDDAFTRIDEGRLKTLIALLTESGHQLIISSNGQREKEILDALAINYKHIEL